MRTEHSEASKAPQFTSTASILTMAREHIFKATYSIPAGWSMCDEQQEIENAKTEPPNLMLCGSLMWTNEYTVLGGDDKAGKSKFIEAWAWRALEGKEFIPGNSCEVPAKDLWIGCIDLELSSSANYKRHGKRLEKWKGTKRFLKIRPDFKTQDPKADPVDTLIELIEQFVWSTGRNVVIVDNLLAALGDISDNPTFIKFRTGLMRIIQERKEAGFWLAFVILIHLTKDAQSRRQEQHSANSRKADFRGAGAMQSLAGSVMEIRPSTSVDGLSLLIVFNTRHGDSEVNFDKGTAYAFKPDHTEGQWDMHFDHVAQIRDHFGKSKPQAPPAISEASKLGKGIEDQIVSLYGLGKSVNAIHKEMKARAGAGNSSPSRQSITEFLKATGREPNGRKFGAK